MSGFNSSQDFLALLRANMSGGENLERMPILDAILQTLSDAGLLVFSTSATPPSANQDTTLWLVLQSPPYGGPGTLYCWNGTSYVLATPGLLYRYLAKSAVAAGIALASTFAFTTGQSLGQNYDDSIFTNTGASASITLTLPSVVETSKWTFVKTVNQAFVVGMPSGVTGNYGGSLTSAGGSFTAGPVGSVMTIRGTDGGYFASAAVGNWTLA